MRLTIILIGILLTTAAGAQEFFAGATGGLVISQIDGDSFGGYHKFAGSGAVYVRNNLGDKWGYKMELRYIQKGSKATNLIYSPRPFYKAALDYIEIPFLFSFRPVKLKIPPTIDLKFNQRLHLQAGLSLGYLFHATEDEGSGPNEATFAFRKIEIGAHAGITWYFGPHWALDYRFSYTVLPIRGFPEVSDLYYWARWEFNRVQTFSLLYEF
ncbi:MAG: PorT family protein [Bacteroidales bacterium]|nr:PorT family protein [Bacteroidales bacterium]